MKELLLHWFIPHYTNNHRPKVLHIDSLCMVALFLVMFNFSLRYIHRTYPEVLGYATDIHVKRLLSETNMRRASNGLAALTLNQTLSQAALKKAEDMFAKGYWSHNNPDGKTPWDFITSTGYVYTVAGENLAKNFTDSKGVVDAWMASPSHKDNVLKPTYKDVGFAVVNGVLNGEETTLVVEMFGTTSVSSFADASKQIKEQANPETANRNIEVPSAVWKEVSVTDQKPSLAHSTLASSVYSAFSDVTKHPILNLSVISRTVSLLFIGAFLGILAVDVLLAKKKRVVRAVGHSGAHMLFFSLILFVVTTSVPGSIL